jgi:hypothetical protein
MCITKATIYLFDWDISTRQRLSVKDVLEKAQTVITISGERDLTALQSVLNQGQWKEKKVPLNNMDVRLVVRLFLADGTECDYYASYFDLISIDFQKSRPITELFRNRFSFSKCFKVE